MTSEHDCERQGRRLGIAQIDIHRGHLHHHRSCSGKAVGERYWTARSLSSESLIPERNAIIVYCIVLPGEMVVCKLVTESPFLPVIRFHNTMRSSNVTPDYICRAQLFRCGI